MPWPRTGATQYHAQLGPQRSKGWLSASQYGKDPLDGSLNKRMVRGSGPWLWPGWLSSSSTVTPNITSNKYVHTHSVQNIFDNSFQSTRNIISTLFLGMPRKLIKIVILLGEAISAQLSGKASKCQCRVSHKQSFTGQGGGGQVRISDQRLDKTNIAYTTAALSVERHK